MSDRPKRLFYNDLKIDSDTKLNLVFTADNDLFELNCSTYGDGQIVERTSDEIQATFVNPLGGRMTVRIERFAPSRLLWAIKENTP